MQAPRPPLTVREVLELVRFALSAFFPREGELPGLAELDLDAKIVALRRESTVLFWVGIVAASIFFQITPLLTVRRPVPAALLSEEELDEHAHKLATYPLYGVRQLIVLLKLVAGIFWAQSPELRAFLHLPAYPPDPGTRRTEPHVARPIIGERAPVEPLVTLGRREEKRGRGRGRSAKDLGNVA